MGWRRERHLKERKKEKANLHHQNESDGWIVVVENEKMLMKSYSKKKEMLLMD